MLEEIGGWGMSEGDSSGVFPCFSPSMFILFHSTNIIGWCGVMVLTPSSS